MSALAMFLLKDPSLLAFDNRRRERPENLHTIFGIKNIPCDSQMRTLLDPLELCRLRAPFRTVFRQLQRGKDFEKMAYYDGHYLLSGDGTVSIPLKTWHLRTVWARNPKTVPSSIINKCLQRPLFIQTVRLLFLSVPRLSVRGTVPTKTIVNVMQLLGFLMIFVGNIISCGSPMIKFYPCLELDQKTNFSRLPISIIIKRTVIRKILTHLNLYEETVTDF